MTNKVIEGLRDTQSNKIFLVNPIERSQEFKKDTHERLNKQDSKYKVKHKLLYYHKQTKYAN